MKKNEFLFDLKTPETTWRGSGKHFWPNGQVASEAGRITDAEGPHGLYWCLDTIMHAVPEDMRATWQMPHFHWHGYETFFVDSGSLYLYINGQRVLCKKGDIVQLQAGQSHGMTFLEETKWRGTYHDFATYSETRDVGRVKRMMPELADDPELAALMPNGEMDSNNMPLFQFDFVDAPAEQCLAVKHVDRPHAAYEFPGLSMRIIVERWENGGTKEMPCAVMEPGFTAEWVKYPPLRELLYVRSGKVKFTVLGQEFIADDECVVNIPRFAPHSIEVLEPSQVFDLGGQSYWSLFLQTYASIRKFHPEDLTPENVEMLKKKYQIQIAKIGMK